MTDVDPPYVSTHETRSVTEASVRRIGAEAGMLLRPIIEETPIEIVCNGQSYAVMMVTPGDLRDFVTGFLCSEQLIEDVSGIRELHLVEGALGWRAEVLLADVGTSVGRTRQRIGDSGCGLCGLGRLEQVARPLKPLSRGTTYPIPQRVLFQALADLEAHQPLNRLCGGAHAAAAVRVSGDVLLVREDVGRHNALDKLIGAASRQGVDLGAGFVLLSSRCSYELVEKAIVAGIPMLVTLSAPTSMAIRRAVAHDLTLVSLARRDSMLVIHDPYGSIAPEVVQ